MFTGIIESLGKVTGVEDRGTNRSFWIESGISARFRPDQSVSHDGVCLTVEEVREGLHKVTAIEETLKKSTLGDWEKGRVINLEQCLLPAGRLDGHIVQGHVDCTAVCTRRKEKQGSWEFRFEFPKRFAPLLIEKGSVTVNGISLTAFAVKKRSFTVAIIPYTYEHSNIRFTEPGKAVNIEFDIIGKYLLRTLSLSAGR